MNINTACVLSNKNQSDESARLKFQKLDFHGGTEEHEKSGNMEDRNETAMLYRRIQQLESFLPSDPYNEQIYAGLIETIQSAYRNQLDAGQAASDFDRVPISNSSLIQKLEVYRKQYSDLFHTTAQFWYDWISFRLEDLKTLSTIPDLTRQALEACPDSLLAGCILKALKRIRDEHEDDISVWGLEEIRTILELCISACGSDILTAETIWRHYIELEDIACDMQLDAVEKSGETHRNRNNDVEVVPDFAFAIKQQFLIPICHRCCAIPMVGMETHIMPNVDHVLELADLSATQQALLGVDDLSTSVLNGIAMRDKRMPYETRLEDEDGDLKQSSEEEFVKAWTIYADFEVNEGQYARAARVYERCILALYRRRRQQTEESGHGKSSILNTSAATLLAWKSYMFMVMRYMPADCALLVSITVRALKDHYAHSPLWEVHFAAVGAWQRQSIPTGKYTSTLLDQQILEIQQKMALALSSGFVEPTDYLRVLRAMWGHSRRVLRLIQQQHCCEPDSELLAMAVDALLQCYQTSTTFLQEYYPNWLQGWLDLYKSQIDTYELYLLPMATAGVVSNDAITAFLPSTVWESAIQRFSNEANLWYEYAEWAAQEGKLSFATQPHCKATHAFDNNSENNRFTLAREVFRRAMHVLPVSTKSLVGDRWACFEQQYGSYATLLEALSAAKDTFINSSKESQSSASNASDSVSKAASAHDRHKQGKANPQLKSKNKSNNNVDLSSSTSSSSSSKVSQKRVREVDDLEAAANGKRAKGVREGAPVPERAPVVEAQVAIPSTAEACGSGSSITSTSQTQQTRPKDQGQPLPAAEQSFCETSPTPTQKQASTPQSAFDEPSFRRKTLYVSNLDFKSTRAEILAHFEELTQKLVTSLTNAESDKLGTDLNTVHNCSDESKTYAPAVNANSAAMSAVDGHESNVTAVQLMLSHSGRSRGLALVTFRTPSLAIAVLKLMQPECRNTAETTLRERVYHVEKIPLELDLKLVHAAATSTTVYCSHLPPTWTELHLRTLFQNTPGKECGAISIVRFLYNHATGMPKHAALVQFETEQGRSKAIQHFKTYQVPGTDSSIQVANSRYPVTEVLIRDHNTVTSSEKTMQKAETSELQKTSKPMHADAAEVKEKKAKLSSQSALQFRPRARTKLAL